MKQPTKAIICAAGIGTRFLPQTKAMPKEMLPVLDKPVLQYIVEELVESGIEEIIFVTSSQKRPIEDHFDRDRDFESFLKEKGKLERLEPLIELCKKVRFFYTRQSEPLGNGHGMLCGREFVGDEPFVFSEGDSIIDAKVPAMKQLLDVFYKEGASVIGVGKTENKESMIKYGNVYGEKISERTYKISEFIEKPPLENVSPHGIYIAGMRYVFTPDIWPFLQNQKKGRDGEIWLADAANALAQEKPFFAYEYEGTYFDTGNKLALLKAALHFAMKDENMKKELQQICCNRLC